LNEIFDAFFFYSAEEYAISGQRFPVTGLEVQLYGSCYSKPFRLPLDLSFGATDPADSLMIELSNANATRERWDYGWKITQFQPGGSVYAQKESQTRMLKQGEYMLQDPAPTAQAGAWIRAFLSKEDTRSQPGFYIVQPEMAPSVEDFQTLVRIYWNIQAEGAPALLRLVTERFNAMRVPFQFKTLRYRNHYQRADSAVLFVGWRYVAITLRLALEIYAAVEPHMKPDTPLFAKRLAPGLALAEDPANGESFGMSRCRMLSQSMLNAYAKRQQSQKARMNELRALFDQAGLSLDTPHLSLSATDHYVSAGEASGLPGRVQGSAAL
jgi:hypothetical protein